MPPRSNEFQRFIRVLEEHLAPQGATVEESVMLPDLHDGTPREVDVLVRVPAGEREIVIGIETQDHKRRADLHWIERLAKKFDSLPIDRRVAVSRRGFSKTALVKARLYNIETLSIEAATRLKWVPELLQIATLDVDEDEFEIVSGRLLSEALHEGQGRPEVLPTSSRLIIRRPNGSAAAVGDIIRDALKKSTLSDKIEEVAGDAAAVRVSVRLRFGPGYLVADARGVDYAATGLLIELLRKRTKRSIKLTHGAYGTAAVATGISQSSDFAMQVAISEVEKGNLQGKTTFRFAPGTQVSEVKMEGKRVWITRKRPPAE